jgi:outer membrane protein assembly factor BamA
MTFRQPRDNGAEGLLLTEFMAEAEQNLYTIRRLEFLGNTWTRDITLRKQTHELQEGEIFRFTTLRHSLKNLSRLRSIYPVRIGDVDAYLNREESTIDLTIYVRPRSRGRR